MKGITSMQYTLLIIFIMAAISIIVILLVTGIVSLPKTQDTFNIKDVLGWIRGIGERGN